MSRTLIVVGSSLVSLSVGAVAGYFYAKKTLEAKYIEEAEQEIEEAKAYNARHHDRNSYDTPEEAAAVLLPQRTPQIPEGLSPLPPTFQKDPEVLERVVKGLKYATTQPDEWENAPVPNEDVDYDDPSLLIRTPGEPYIITAAEFKENEKEHQQVNLTYFNDDGVLIDDLNEIIDEVNSMVGLKNLEHFGRLSDSPNTLYIRNEAMDVDFEVILEQDSYANQFGPTSSKKQRPRQRSNPSEE